MERGFADDIPQDDKLKAMKKKLGDWLGEEAKKADGGKEEGKAMIAVKALNKFVKDFEKSIGELYSAWDT